MASTKLQGDVYVTLPEGLGGGDATDALKYIPQTLTEAQQMQARANQGLYYKESELSDTLEWDGNTEGLESVDGFYKVSEPVDPSLLNNCVVTTVSEGEYDSMTVSPVQNPMYPTVYTIASAFLVTEDTEFMGETWSKGIWFYNGGEGDSVVSIQATAQIFNTTTVHHIEPEYIPDTVMKKVPTATPGNLAILDSGGNVNELPAGTEGQVLTQGVNGAEWADPAGGELDDNVTSSSVNAVKSSGIYAAVNSAIDSDTETTAVSEALVVGKTYKFMPSAGVATLAFTLTPPTEDVVRFWRFKFKSGATATEFVPPSNLYWVDGKAFIPEANTIYELMIDEDYCVSVLAFKQVSNG